MFIHSWKWVAANANNSSIDPPSSPSFPPRLANSFSHLRHPGWIRLPTRFFTAFDHLLSKLEVAPPSSPESEL